MIDKTLANGAGDIVGLPLATKTIIENMALKLRGRQSAPTVFKIGEAVLSIRTLVPQTMERGRGYQWAEIPRLGENPALQFMGQESETLTLSGVAYAEMAGENARSELKKLEDKGKKGEPLPMVDGAGNVYGNWVLLSLREEAVEVWGDGTPRKTNFTITLKRYEG